MMCYRDMEFCADTDRCGTLDCHRRLTDEVRAAAARWWGSDDAPIAVGERWDGCNRRSERAILAASEGGENG